MRFPLLARPPGWLLLAALWPAFVLASNETYEGLLVPSNREAPITIVVQLQEVGGFLSGRVKVGAPFTGNAPIDSGRNVAGSCKFTTVLSSSITLRLSGTCSATVIEGIYVVNAAKPKTLGRGTFRITRTLSAVERKGLDDSGTAAGSVTACLKANTRCLMACPRGGESAEYLCANRCRTNLQACKAKVAKEIDLIE